MGRGRNRKRRMSALSWVIFRSKTHLFRNFFEVNFLDDFLMDFYRFWMDFGRVWEVKILKKSKIWLIFWVCFWKPHFWSKFLGFFIKTMAKHIWKFRCFSICCFIICLLNLLFSVMLETFKIVIFLMENAYFHKISFFAFDAQRRRKTSQTTIDWEGERAPKINEIWMPERNKHPMKNWWFLRSKLRKNVKKSSPRRMFVSITSLNGF